MSERELGIIIAKLEALHEDILDLKDAAGDNDERINQLEQFKAWTKGVGSLCMVFLTTLISYIKLGGH